MGSANSGLKSDNFRKKTQFFEKSLRVSDFATEPIFDKDKPGNRKNATKLTYDHRGYRLHFLKRLVDPRLHLHPPGPGMFAYIMIFFLKNLISRVALAVLVGFMSVNFGKQEHQLVLFHLMST